MIIRNSPYGMTIHEDWQDLGIDIFITISMTNGDKCATAESLWESMMMDDTRGVNFQENFLNMNKW